MGSAQHTCIDVYAKSDIAAASCAAAIATCALGPLLKIGPRRRCSSMGILYKALENEDAEDGMNTPAWLVPFDEEQTVYDAHETKQ
jgi:hypothetical protein